MRGQGVPRVTHQPRPYRLTAGVPSAKCEWRSRRDYEPSGAEHHAALPPVPPPVVVVSASAALSIVVGYTYTVCGVSVKAANLIA